MRLGVVASSDPVPTGVSGARRRPRAEAARSESVWVRLSPGEATLVGEAAARAGLSVGAWVGETAVGRAHADAAGDGPGEAGGVGLSSWRELVAALVALRAEVAAVRCVPVVEFGPAVSAGGLLDERLADNNPGSNRGGADLVGVVGVLWRIDAVTAAAVNAGLSSARRSSRMRSGAPGAVVITKVVHGWRPAGLVAYLLGPGTAEVHREPRVIASWDGLDAGWQPASTGSGEYDLALGPLMAALHAPAVAAGLPTRAPAEHGKRGYVWHCSARVAAADRVLSDGEWAGIARELLDGAGIAVSGDAGGPRWVAIRHAQDHIHIAAVLVRQDTARRFWPHQDYPKLRAAARRVEQRLGLTVTAAPDGTAAPRPTRGEMEKADREGRVPARVELRRVAQQAAVAATGIDGFVGYLQEHGYRVGLRRAPSGDLLGYKLARPGDLTGAGEPVFYSGSKLAPDLSLPRLQQRWKSTPAQRTAGGAGRGPEVCEVLGAVAAARAALRAGSEDGDGIGAATADLLTALAGPASGGWGERWGTAADRFDRAARAPGGHPLEPGPVAGELRVLARRLLTGRGRAGRDAVGGVALAVALAALVAEIAAWQTARGRDHQAAASRRTAMDATELVLEQPPAARSGRAQVPGGGNGRARGTPRPRGGSRRSRRRQNSEPTMTPPTGNSRTSPSPVVPSAAAPASPPASQPTLWADRP